jgi:hypothetical protein
VIGPVGPNSTTPFPVTGHGGVPATGVRAVLLNVETVNQTGASHLQLFPDGEQQSPDTAMLDVWPGQTRENVAAVVVGADGKVDVYNFAGSADLVINLQGYFTSTTGGLGTGVVGCRCPRPVNRAVPASSSTTRRPRTRRRLCGPGRTAR